MEFNRESIWAAAECGARNVQQSNFRKNGLSGKQDLRKGCLRRGGYLLFFSFFSCLFSLRVFCGSFLLSFFVSFDFDIFYLRQICHKDVCPIMPQLRKNHRFLLWKRIESRIWTVTRVLGALRDNPAEMKELIFRLCRKAEPRFRESGRAPPSMLSFFGVSTVQEALP
jgi:hypothetical protein